MDIKEIEQIVAILKQNDVTEFELSHHDGTHLKLARARPAPAVQVPAVMSHAAALEPAIVGAGALLAHMPAQAVNAGSNGAAVLASNLIRVESPIVGTFYRKASPDVPAFVTEGDRVKKGDTLCIVEAMKLMNEIEAPASGKIEKILLTDGNVVEFGEVLMIINPD